jgi:hypothetical protein
VKSHLVLWWRNGWLSGGAGVRCCQERLLQRQRKTGAIVILKLSRLLNYGNVSEFRKLRAVCKFIETNSTTSNPFLSDRLDIWRARVLPTYQTSDSASFGFSCFMRGCLRDAMWSIRVRGVGLGAIYASAFQTYISSHKRAMHQSSSVENKGGSS